MAQGEADDTATPCGLLPVYIYVVAGELSLTLDFEAQCLEAGQALLITPGQVCQFSLGIQPEAYALLFEPDFLGQAAEELHLLHHIRDASQLGYRVVSLEGLPISPLIGQLQAELATASDSYQRMIAVSCVRILLVELARRLPQELGAHSGLAMRFVAAVEQHFTRWYNVSDYLSFLGVTDKALGRALKQALGQTPKSYIDQRRVLEAKRLLVYSELSVKELAYHLGFDEPTNFNKFFRKHTEQSPLDFRAWAAHVRL